MINKEKVLSKKIFSKGVEKKAMRDGFGEALVLAGEKDEKIVVLTADLKESTRAHLFAEKFPGRFIEVGVAEQALVTIASGMAVYGKIPFATSYAVFSPGRNWEQIRTTICLNDVPVKIVGCHAGLGSGPYGATHQALEDIALMRSLPNMIVVCPCDYEEAKKATIAIAKTNKPSYLRLAREETPVLTTPKTAFKIGRAEVFWSPSTGSGPHGNPEVAIVACGTLVYEALLVAKLLEKRGIETQVINCHTIKPLDERTIIRSAKTCGAVVTVEEHQLAGGLGSAIAEVLSQNFPVPIEFVGIKDFFGESGTPEELKKKFGLTSKDIIEAVKRVMVRKNY